MGGLNDDNVTGHDMSRPVKGHPEGVTGHDSAPIGGASSVTVAPPGRVDVALDGSPDPETATKVRAIEAALDALLRTMIRDRRERAERRSAAGPSATPLRAIHISELLAMSADQLELDDLLDDPVGAACRKGVRRCGKALHKLGGLELMRDACDSVAERDPDTWGYRTSIMDSAWNGVGSDDGGRWWS